ncbi:MAG: hypothetical protein ACI3Z9_04890 [Candidatus Onthomorpha sp.]
MLVLNALAIAGRKYLCVGSSMCGLFFTEGGDRIVVLQGQKPSLPILKNVGVTLW